MYLVLVPLLFTAISANRLLQQFTPPIIDSSVSVCGGFQNCLEYSADGCNLCSCSGACTKMACFPQQPARCTVCDIGYTLTADGQCELAAPPSCGGIPYCISYKPDNCNICGCGNGLTMAFCTRAFCGPSNPTNECTRCMDGYSLNTENQCEQTLFVEAVTPSIPSTPAFPAVPSNPVNPSNIAPIAQCVCPMMYSPVCCAEKTYPNSCEARCQGVMDTTQCAAGRCSDPLGSVQNFEIPHVAV